MAKKKPIPPSGWQNRIVGEGQEAPDQLLASPQNWRIHSHEQETALATVLDKVGWVQRVIVNKATGHVVDGHLRVAMAISRNEASVPVLYVDLAPEEEALILATLDPLSAMAGTDKGKLKELLSEISHLPEELASWLGEMIMPGQMAKAFSEGEGEGEGEGLWPAPIFYLDDEQNRAWDRFKEKVGIRDNKGAFLCAIGAGV